MAAHYPTPDGVRFKELTDFPGYGVGSDGSVWTRRKAGRPHEHIDRLKPEWTRLAIHIRSGSYRRTSVALMRDSKRRTFAVHRLVLEAFVGPRLPGQVCRHLDGDATNNNIENLRWGTDRENWYDTFNHGRAFTQIGSMHSWSILTEADIPEIFRLRAAGFTFKQLAARYSVAVPTICNVLYRKQWKHVIIPQEFES